MITLPIQIPALRRSQTPQKQMRRDDSLTGLEPEYLQTQNERVKLGKPYLGKELPNEQKSQRLGRREERKRSS